MSRASLVLTDKQCSPQITPLFNLVPFVHFPPSQILTVVSTLPVANTFDTPETATQLTKCPCASAKTFTHLPFSKDQQRIDLSSDTENMILPFG